MSWWRDHGYHTTDDIAHDLNSRSFDLGSKIWEPKLHFENLSAPQ